MRLLNAGALRRAAAAVHLDAAGELVRQTLARHGLMADLPPRAPGAATPVLDEWLKRAPGKAVDKAAPRSEATVPGASFAADRFENHAGGRDFLTYIPASAAQKPTGLVMMLHGCTQTHADFAVGTGMNALAERHGFVVLYPLQSRGENMQSCWNWFSPHDQRRDRGEPAILAGMARHVASAQGVPADRVFVAGLSAGAAMAVILGQTHDDTFAAIGAHSGLPYGAAHNVPSAFAAMSGAGGTTGGASITRPTPSIVFHGTADATVTPANGARIAADLIAAGPEQTLFESRQGQANGRRFACEITSNPEGAPLLEFWRVDGLAHAWSGGRPEGSYTDPAGPDASAEMIRFFFEQPRKGALT